MSSQSLEGTGVSEGTDRQARARAWRARSAAMVGCLGVGLLAAVASAQSVLLLDDAWDPPTMEDYIADPYPPAFGPDEAVDTAVWDDGETTWVYVLGTMTNDYGAHVFGIYRYDINNPANNDKLWFPSNHASTTVDHVPTAMAIDGETGAVYCTGSIYSGQERDYLTVRFLANLSGVDTSWSDNDGVEIYNNDEGDGEDFAVDITVYGTGDFKRAVVTGTSTDDQDGTDIVTIGYYTDDSQLPGQSWIHWEDALDNVAEHGNETATELAVTSYAGQDGGVGVAVAGTSDSGDDGLDMIVCLYRPDGDSMIRHWGQGASGYRLYNGPADGDDVCTGLASTWGLEQASVYTLCLCGKTPKYPAYTGDTEYLTWAVSSGDGSDYWSSGTYYGGRAWSPDPDEHGADVAYDIALAPPYGETVWLTGECEYNETWDIGTISYYVTGVQRGQLFSTPAVYDSPVADGRDDRGRAIVPLADSVFVTGWTDGYADPSVLTLQYGTGGSLYALGRVVNDYYARGARLFYDALNDALIVVGASVDDPYYGIAWIVMRYNP